ncbi:MAG: hypothetical protein RLZZ450_2958 [Pseudomonadota bacterium]|jgi:hypothetical protein
MRRIVGNDDSKSLGIAIRELAITAQAPEAMAAESEPTDASEGPMFGVASFSVESSAVAASRSCRAAPPSSPQASTLRHQKRRAQGRARRGHAKCSFMRETFLGTSRVCGSSAPKFGDPSGAADARCLRSSPRGPRRLQGGRLPLRPRALLDALSGDGTLSFEAIIQSASRFPDTAPGASALSSRSSAGAAGAASVACADDYRLLDALDRVARAATSQLSGVKR